MRHVERAGASVADLTPEAAAQLGYPKGTAACWSSAWIASARPRRPGCVKGQVVVKVDRTPVASAAEFAGAVAAATPDRGALLHVMRPTGEVDFVVLRVK